LRRRRSSQSTRFWSPPPASLFPLQTLFPNKVLSASYKPLIEEGCGLAFCLRVFVRVSFPRFLSAAKQTLFQKTAFSVFLLHLESWLPTLEGFFFIFFSRGWCFFEYEVDYPQSRNLRAFSRGKPFHLFAGKSPLRLNRDFFRDGRELHHVRLTG